MSKFEGKTFAGKWNTDKIIKKAKAFGYEVDTRDYDAGSDGIWLRDFKKRQLQIYYNVCTGSFYVYAPIKNDGPIATHLSTNMDNVDWYKELLDMFYVPEEKKEGTTV